MDDLTRAAKTLNKLKDVRVVYLPPMTVTSCFVKGEQPEEKAWSIINDFVRRNDLLQTKPDLRLFKINHHNATGESFGYEIWVSIPETMEVSAPLAKKHFLGGQYAAYVQGERGFEVALGLQDWVNESEKYQFDYQGYLKRCDPPLQEIDSLGGMSYDLAEVLDFRNNSDATDNQQIDLLIPVKNYTTLEEASKEIAGSKERCGYATSITTKSKFRIIGFTKIMTPDSSDVDAFIADMKADGRLELLRKLRKPGAPILKFESIDMDSQLRGGWRTTFCLVETDVTDVDALMALDPFVWHIDATQWLIFTRTKGEAFDDHAVCTELGYIWNGIISGSFTAYPDGDIEPPDPSDEAAMNVTVYNWYPIKKS